MVEIIVLDVDERLIYWYKYKLRVFVAWKCAKTGGDCVRFTICVLVWSKAHQNHLLFHEFYQILPDM